MSRREKLFLLAMAGMVVVGIGVSLFSDFRKVPVESGLYPSSETRSPVSFPLDLNIASSRDFEALKGIGPVKASAIVAYREAHGGFRYVEDLLEVSGIGEKTLEGIKDWVHVGNTDSFSSSIPERDGKIHINLASEKDLLRLPGIGPVKAASIMDYRNTYGPFTSIDQLMEVRGIGPVTLEDIRHMVTID